MDVEFIELSVTTHDSSGATDRTAFPDLRIVVATRQQTSRAVSTPAASRAGHELGIVHRFRFGRDP